MAEHVNPHIVNGMQLYIESVMNILRFVTCLHQWPSMLTFMERALLMWRFCDEWKDRGYAVVVRLLLWRHIIIRLLQETKSFPHRQANILGKWTKSWQIWCMNNVISLSRIFLNSNFVWSWSRRGDVYLTRLPIWGSLIELAHFPLLWK